MTSGAGRASYFSQQRRDEDVGIGSTAIEPASAIGREWGRCQRRVLDSPFDDIDLGMRTSQAARTQISGN